MSQTCVSSIVVSDDVSSRRVPRKAIDLPSGDQAGEYSALFVRESMRCEPSATFTARIS